MALFGNLRKCVGKRQGLQRRRTKVLFNNLPTQLKDLLVYIARDGVAVADLFRRPGNPRDIKKIISDLESGRIIEWKAYSFYTLANIAKRYLLHIDGGILGPEAETRMLKMLDSPDDQLRMEAMHNVLTSQPKPVQQLLALLFGIWFRMIYHTEVNAMSVESIAKSVAGSIFPSTTTSPEKVERASKVMEYLITGFASADLFSRELIEYFTTETRTSISRVEKFKYEFRFPKDVPREVSIRLFVQLLQEESEKHGFDLVRDAVSKETFDNANWENACPNTRSVTESQTEDVPTPPLPTVYQPKVDSCAVPPDSPRSLRFKVRDGLVTETTEAVLRTMPTTTVTRTPTKISSGVLNPFNDPVQQLSEKHTCVTATPLHEQPHDHGDMGRFTAKIHEPHAMRGNQTPGDRLTNQAACFNSVKRRQLERLQKRSDWFLSPPAGLRATGRLMHLDPNSSGTVPLKDQNACDRNPAVPSVWNAKNSAPVDVDAEWVISPTATSSPKRVPQFRLSNPVNNENKYFEDKENLPEVEVRYFVVERYYGPEPRSAFMDRTNSNPKPTAVSAHQPATLSFC